MEVLMTRWTTFQCAHHLPQMPDGHKCRNVHGHTYKLVIGCRGPVDEDGLVFDNALIDDVLKVIHSNLDHQDLNALGFPFSDNPTAERLVLWMYKLALATPKVGPSLSFLELFEGDRSSFRIDVPSFP